MKEMQYIMKTMTNNSLVIIDELCRSTSLEEGTAIAIALVEKLVQSSAFIYITTHFTLLTKLYDMYLNVKVWQMETIPSGEDPKTFKLDFKHNLIPGVTSVKRYGVYIVRNIWPDSMLRDVDALLDSISKKPKDPNILPLDSKIRLKYNVESKFRKLKSQRKLTIAEVNKLLNQYQDDLTKLGCVTNMDPLSASFAENVVQEVPSIQHSIFGDLHPPDVKMIQYFTPQPSSSSQLSANLEMQREMEKMKKVFTPEQSQQSDYLNQSCPNLNFYQNQTERAQHYPDHAMFHSYENVADNYENISQFIAENFENINKLMPEVNLSYQEVANDSFVEKQINFAPQTDFLCSPSIAGSIRSERSSKNDFRFTLPTENDTARTSTPITHGVPQLLNDASPIVHLYENRNNFFSSPNPSSQSFYKNRGIVVPKHQNLEGIDLESLQEDLEICSRIFTEDGGDFERECLNTSYRSLENNHVQLEERTETHVKEKHQHIFPIVTIKEGLNNTTLSFDEDDFKDIPDNREVKETLPKHINILSNILIEPSEATKPRTGQNRDLQQEKKLELHTPFIADEATDAPLSITQPNVNEEETNLNSSANAQQQQDIRTDESMASSMASFSIKDKANNLNQANAKSESSHLKQTHYKSFDSTFSAARTRTETESSECAPNNSFKSARDDDTASVYSCRTERDVSKTDSVSNCYKITVVDDPKEFVASSVDKTTTKEKSVEENKEIISCETQTAKEDKSSSPHVDKTEIASVSYASKLRKLDQDTSGSSPQHENGMKKTAEDKTITSISSASKKRNLDQATTDSATTNEKSDDKTKDSDKLETSSSLKESDESKSKRKALKRKFSMPRSRETQNESDSTDPSEKRKTVKKSLSKPKFIPPRKLTAKEIREEFEEQDRKMLESSPSNLSKYLEQLIKRPTVKQIRNTTHLAMIRKTEKGVEVIPSNPPRKKPKPGCFKKHCSNESFNSENFNVAIFSDKNALPFENFLNSNEKDYTTFSFNFNRNQEEGQKFQFAPTTLSFGEYTNNSVTKRFARTVSESICSQQNGKENISFYMTQQSVNQTLTPDGFYKQNRDVIKRIMGKYLDGGGTQENRSCFGNIDRSRSIFENNDIDPSDLNI